VGKVGLCNTPLQPFSQKSRTPTVAKVCQIGLYDPAEADLELFRNSWSAGFLGERLYVKGVRPQNTKQAQHDQSNTYKNSK